MSYAITRPCQCNSINYVLSQAECEGAARSIGWVKPLKVEDFPEGSPFSKSMRMTCFFLEAAEKRVAELEWSALQRDKKVRSLESELATQTQAKNAAVIEWTSQEAKIREQSDRIAELERERDDLKFNAGTYLSDKEYWKQCAGKAEKERDEWRAKYEAIKPPEKTTGLTHAEVERLMKETPGRVASCATLKRRWFDGEWQYGDGNTWRKDTETKTGWSLQWSIEPLAEPGDGLVPFVELKYGDWFEYNGRKWMKTDFKSLENHPSAVNKQGRHMIFTGEERVRRVEGPR